MDVLSIRNDRECTARIVALEDYRNILNDRECTARRVALEDYRKHTERTGAR